ncbi:MAG TPA: hypothetical protein VKA00_06445 [Trueperaceae bacterium]|nr:hypothetical protein [Trueperaceae bacterium]
MTPATSELRPLLGETGAYREGHFEIAEGQHVLSYYSCERLFQYPALASRAADALYRAVSGVDADFVFTPSISALTLAFELARRTSWQFAVHALPFTSSSYRFPEGTRVLVVEDVVVSGRSLAHARAWCGERGAEVAAYGVLVDRRPEEGDLGGIRLIAGLRDPVRVFVPDACPACRDAVPLVRVERNYPEGSA